MDYYYRNIYLLYFYKKKHLKKHLFTLLFIKKLFNFLFIYFTFIYYFFIYLSHFYITHLSQVTQRCSNKHVIITMLSNNIVLVIGKCGLHLMCCMKSVHCDFSNYLRDLQFMPTATKWWSRSFSKICQLPTGLGEPSGKQVPNTLITAWDGKFSCLLNFPHDKLKEQ